MQVLERQKAWQQRWRERHERKGTLYDAVAVVEDVIIGRSVCHQCIVAVTMAGAENWEAVMMLCTQFCSVMIGKKVLRRRLPPAVFSLLEQYCPCSGAIL